MNTSIKENNQLKVHVKGIIQDIEQGYFLDQENINQDTDYTRLGYKPGDMISGYHYLADYYDVEYYISHDKKTVNGARFMVGCGGPSIYVDTRFKEVQGYWGNDEYIGHYCRDAMNISEVAGMLWGPYE